MTDLAELDPMLVHLTRKLCDAGALDAAVSVIDFLKARGASGRALLPLQAQAFACEDCPVERKREVLRSVRVATLDAMARMGALVACAAVYKLLSEVFADDRIWRRKLRRVELVLTALPDAEGDPERAAVAELLQANRTHDALGALRALVLKCPDDAKLKQRAEELHNLLFEPSTTRPYRVMSPDEAERLSSPSYPPEPDGALHALPAPPIPLSLPAPAPPLDALESAPAAIDPAPVRTAVLSALLAGELSRAEPAARTLARILRDEASAAAAEAVERLASIQRAETASNATDEITMRLSPEATVDLWIRQGMLARARDQARELLGRPENKGASRALSQRLNDLDRVLALVPVPEAPPPPAEPEVIRLYDAEETVSDAGMAPPAVRIASMTTSATEEVSRVESTGRWVETAPVAPTLPPASPAPSSPSVGAFDDRLTTEFSVMRESAPTPEAPPAPSPPPAPPTPPPAPDPPAVGLGTRKRKVVRLG